MKFYAPQRATQRSTRHVMIELPQLKISSFTEAEAYITCTSGAATALLGYGRVENDSSLSSECISCEAAPRLGAQVLAKLISGARVSSLESNFSKLTVPQSYNRQQSLRRILTSPSAVPPTQICKFCYLSLRAEISLPSHVNGKPMQRIRQRG